ncbi:MAG: transposase [Spirulinaceae cyanobacterium SM2_1_0]|nr:transposase [Spirulinaceae cyanobacterium SM2_1_0]
MLSIPEAVSEVLTPFQVLFVQQRSWQKGQALLVGALMCQGKRTMSRVLSVMGLAQERDYGNYYRLLSRVGWSGLTGARILLGLIVSLLLVGQPVVIGIDDTLERRWGKRIWGAGIYRDPVKSSHKHKVKSSGVRWQVMQVLVSLPWSQRVWGLPFFSVLMPSQATPRVGNRAYKTSLDWAAQMVSQVSRWLKRHWICVGDGSFGNAKFGWACRRHGTSLVARLPWKANLYDFAPVLTHRYPGRPRTKGARLPSMQQQLDSLGFESGAFHRLRWYGGTQALRQLVTGTALWNVSGYPPLPVRWVLVIDPTGQQPPTALFSTNLMLPAQTIVEVFVSRWSLEVTFQEARAHLGVQSQRQWSKAATTRTTPVLLALFSLTCLIALRLHALTPITPRTTAWYANTELTFADLLYAVRASLWHVQLFSRPALLPTLALFPQAEREQLIHLLSSS